MDMMKVLFPVLSMMLIGMFCRKSGLISEKGIQDLKTLMTQIILPVAVFNALATAEYGVHLFGLVGVWSYTRSVCYQLEITSYKNLMILS